MTIYKYEGKDPAAELQRVEDALEVLESKVATLQDHRFSSPANGGGPHEVPELARAELGALARGRAALWLHDGLGGLNTWARVVSRLYAPPSSYASLGLATPTVLGTIGAGWTGVPFDDDTPTPRFAITDLATDSWAYGFNCVYACAVTLQFSHDSSNQGRTTNVRLVERDSGTPGNGVPIGIGRNVEDTLATVVFPVEVSVTAFPPNTYLQLQLGGGSTLSSVTLNAARVLTWAIGVSEVP